MEFDVFGETQSYISVNCLVFFLESMDIIVLVVWENNLYPTTITIIYRVCVLLYKIPYDEVPK